MSGVSLDTYRARLVQQSSGYADNAIKYCLDLIAICRKMQRATSEKTIAKDLVKAEQIRDMLNFCCALKINAIKDYEKECENKGRN